MAQPQAPSPPTTSKPKGAPKSKSRGRKTVTALDLQDYDVTEHVPEEPPKVEHLYQLTKPGQTITEALKETTAVLEGELAKHFPGWTPQLDLAADFQQQKRRREEKERERAEQLKKEGEMEELQRSQPSQAASSSSVSPKKPSKEKPQREVVSKKKKKADRRSKSPSHEEDATIRKQLERAGEPGSHFWNPSLLKQDVTDVLEHLHTESMEELLQDQLAALDEVVKRNENLPKWLAKRNTAADELQSSAENQFDGLAAKLEKAEKKTTTSLENCKRTGTEMVDVIQDALDARERIRQMLLNDADIVVTDEKRALLEERRRQGQDLSAKMIDVRKQEEEDGSGGIKEPQAVSDLKERIARRQKKHKKLKNEHDQVQTRLRALEQALRLLDKGEKAHSQNSKDDAALEIIEEAKGIAREQVLAPLLRKLEKEHDLTNVGKLELPQELLDERDQIKAEIEKVEGDIRKMEEEKTKEEEEQREVVRRISTLDNDAERVLTNFSISRRRSSSLLVTQVAPPMAAPMPQIDVERGEQLKAGLKKSFRAYHRELAVLVDYLPKYLTLVGNAQQTAEQISQQRLQFIAHIRSMKDAFLKDLRAGGAKKIKKEDEEIRIDEDELMQKVEAEWNKEEARLCEGHLALDKRVQFFSSMAQEVTQELSSLQVAVDKSRWAMSDILGTKPAQRDRRGSVHAEPAAQKRSSVARASTMAAAFNKAGTAVLSNIKAAKDEQAGAGIKRASSGWNFALRRTSNVMAGRPRRRGSIGVLESSSDEGGEAASERELAPYLAFQQDDDVYVNKAEVAFRIRDNEVLQKFILEGEQAEEEDRVQKKLQEEERLEAEALRLQESEAVQERQVSVSSESEGSVKSMDEAQSPLLPEGSDSVAPSSGGEMSPGETSPSASGSVRSATLKSMRQRFRKAKNVTVSIATMSGKMGKEGDSEPSSPGSRTSMSSSSAIESRKSMLGRAKTGPLMISRDAAQASDRASGTFSPHSPMTPRTSSSGSKAWGKIRAQTTKLDDGGEGGTLQPIAHRHKGKKKSTRLLEEIAKSSQSLSSHVEGDGEPAEGVTAEEKPGTDQPPNDEVEEDDDQLAIGEDVSEGLRTFLELDHSSRRLERQIGKGSERLASLRKELVGKDAGLLDLDRLKFLPGDEKTHHQARDAVKDLRQSWQDFIRRRQAAGKGLQLATPADGSEPAPLVIPSWTRCRTEEEAFEETYAQLFAEISQ